MAPALTVPEPFLGKPVPVTVTAVPAGPLAGLRLRDGEAAWAGTAARGQAERHEDKNAGQA